jgi:hypothetical protein
MASLIIPPAPVKLYPMETSSSALFNPSASRPNLLPLGIFRANPELNTYVHAGTPGCARPEVDSVPVQLRRVIGVTGQQADFGAADNGGEVDADRLSLAKDEFPARQLRDNQTG